MFFIGHDQIRVRPSVREVVATYTVDDGSMELIVVIPANFPLHTWAHNQSSSPLKSSNILAHNSKGSSLLAFI